MIGLFQELGPCGIDINGSVYNNPYAWNRKTNLIFVDEPTTVGFSYGVPKPGYIDAASGDFITLPNTTCPDYAVGTCATYSEMRPALTANSTAAAAPNMWKTLQGFMGAFPQYSRGSFHFTTESYGGHYGPVFNEYFEEQNAKNIPGAHQIKLESVAIGNGWYDPLINYQAYYNYTVFPGNTYDYRPYNESTEAKLYNSLYGEGNCYDQLKQCSDTGRNDVCSAADNFCATHVESVLDIVADRDEYDIRELQPDPFPYNFFLDYLNTPKVQKAIGAFTNYTESSPQVGADFGSTGDDGREDDTIEDIQKLLKKGINFMMYFGDADYNCNWLGGEVIAELINVGNSQYNTAGYQNIQTSDNITHGQVKQAGNFTFARFYYAGHEVPFYQPLASLEVFERHIFGKDIRTGTISPVPAGYKTVGPAKSTYREGNSTVQTEVLPTDAIYDTTLGGPKPTSKKRSTRLARDSKSGSNSFKVQ